MEADGADDAADCAARVQADPRRDVDASLRGDVGDDAHHLARHGGGTDRRVARPHLRLLPLPRRVDSQPRLLRVVVRARLAGEGAC